MKRVEMSVVINRPIDEVFEIVDAAENDHLSRSGPLESEQISEGPMGVGTTTREVRTFLGRRMEGTAEVIECEQNAKLGVKSTSGPEQGQAWAATESVPGGTRHTMVTEAEIRRLLQTGRRSRDASV